MKLFPVLSMILTSSFAFAGACPANMGSNIGFHKGSVVVLDSYNSITRTYSIVSVKSDGRDKYEATLQALAQSCGDIRRNYDDIKDQPDSVIDKSCETEADLPTLTDEEIETRKNCTD